MRNLIRFSLLALKKKNIRLGHSGNLEESMETLDKHIHICHYKRHLSSCFTFLQILFVISFFLAFIKLSQIIKYCYLNNSINSKLNSIYKY